MKKFKAFLLVLMLIPFAIFATACQSKSINDAQITIEQQTYHYTGSEITPIVTVKIGRKTLEENKDYTVTYENNIALGTASLTVTGNGKYTGSKTITFEIVEGIIDDVFAIDAQAPFSFDSQFTIGVIGIKEGDIVSYKTSEDEEYTTEQLYFTSVGNFTIYFKVERENYQPYFGQATLTIFKGEFEYEDFTAENQTYDGTPKSPDIFNYITLHDGMTITYSTNPSQPFTSEMPTFTERGNYKVYLKLEHDYMETKIIVVDYTIE